MVTTRSGRKRQESAPKSKPASKPAPKRKSTKKGCKQRKVSAYNMYQREVFKRFAKSISDPKEAIKRAGKELATPASKNYYQQNKAKYEKQAKAANVGREICPKSRKEGYVKDIRKRKIVNLSAFDALRLNVFRREKNGKMQWLYGKREMPNGTTKRFYVGGTIGKTNPRADKYYWSTLSPIKSRDCGDGKIRSRKTGKCVVKKEPCIGGYARSRTTGRCQLKNKKKPCPKGKRRNSTTGRCRVTGGKKVKKACPKGTTRNKQTGRCRKNKVPAGVIAGARRPRNSKKPRRVQDEDSVTKQKALARTKKLVKEMSKPKPKPQTKDLNAMSTARNGNLEVEAGSLLMGS